MKKRITITSLRHPGVVQDEREPAQCGTGFQPVARAWVSARHRLEACVPFGLTPIPGVASSAVKRSGCLRLRRFFCALVATLFAGVSLHAADKCDIYLFAGQSNMDGRGQAADLAEFQRKPSERVVIFYRNLPFTSVGWKPLVPGYSVAPDFKGKALPSGTFGPEIGFAEAMVKAQPGHRFALIKGSKGGTSLAKDWNPGVKDKPETQGPRYRDFLETIALATKALKDRGSVFSIHGLLWHQGESDHKDTAEVYLARLTKFIARIREDLAMPELPVAVGEVFNDGTRDGVRKAQRDVAASVPHVAFVSADGTTTWDKGTHFDAASQLLLGRRFADAMLSSDTPAIFRDPTQPIEKRVEDLVRQLTLEEKAMLLDHMGPTLERFNIRSDQWNQCLNGVKWNRPTTLFPSCIALTATWDTTLVREVATVLSDEARAIYNGWHLDPNAPGEHKGLIYRAPVINIERNPYWGRNHEAWGEDPFLTGGMAVAYVRGLQGNDPRYLKIAATLKHYAVNNVEAGRKALNAIVPETMLRDYWLPHFRDAIVEGGAQSVMASYNAINGTPNNVNRWLLTDVLKNEWKHDGFVVSDLGGVRTMVTGHGKGKMNYVDAVAQSLMAGCDFSDKEYRENIPAAVEVGKLTEARLNDAVSRVLRVRFRLGEFDPFESVPYSKIAPGVVCSAQNRAVALEAAKESIVLLQNRDGFLPLDRAKIKRIAVLGPLADRVVLNNYNGKPDAVVSALKGIQDRIVPGTEVLYEKGCETTGSDVGQSGIARAAELARTASVALVCIGTDERVEQEGHDRRTLGLTGNQEALVKAVLAANRRTIVVQMSAGPITELWLKENVPAILQAWWGGEETGHALAGVLFGEVNPAGRLPHTVYASETQAPPQNEYDISKGFTYMYLKVEPLYPFGHGLSYTAFEYSDLKVSGAPLAVEATVKNTGQRMGDEVVQVYLDPPKSALIRPRLMLRGFQRVSLAPGQSKRVSFKVPDEKLAFWNADTKRFEVQLGDWGVQVGASSSDIRLHTRFTK